MTTIYKLTDDDGYTRREHINALKWEPGVTHKATGEGNELCTDGVIHGYTDPVLAVMMNSTHGCYYPCRMFLCKGEIIAEVPDKVGVKELTCIEEMIPPVVTTEQHVRFGILAAKEVCNDPKWNEWADNWLSGKDRSKESAQESAQMVEDSIRNMESDVVWAAWDAIWAAKYAAWAAKCMAGATKCTAIAVRSVAVVNPNIDLVALAHKAMED